ncbi:hypothetical protein AAF712_012177 [Marasmius tenuissimus]|uniref:Uncharacterized protein n=1 Tax=Marasmius tenuissimus TaxID=585030 RepID=A0ABR2ZJ68_9AGAR
MSDFDTRYPRRITVDDKDSRITYDGVWNYDESTFADVGTNGDPYNQSMTVTNSAQTSFTFTFEGDFVQVNSLDLFPTFTCQIDGNPDNPVGYDSFIGSTTNPILCERQLSKARHTLTMNITVSVPEKQNFWLDLIEYSPLDTANLTSAEGGFERCKKLHLFQHKQRVALVHSFCE